MGGFWAFLRILWQSTKLFATLIWPTLALLASYVVVWYVSRKVAKLQEQRAIVKHLSQVTREEIEGRDERITRLERENRDLKADSKQDKAKLRAVRGLLERAQTAAITEPVDVLEEWPTRKAWARRG